MKRMVTKWFIFQNCCNQRFSVVVATSTLVFLGISLCFSQGEISPWEKLGLSKTEWLMIQDNQIPMSKIGELLQSGIGIEEYVSKPWIGLELTEERWIAKRRSGLTSIEIATGITAPKDEQWKEGTRESAKSDMMALSGASQKFTALFLPGYQQHKAGGHLKGNIMIGMSVGSVVGCTIWSIKTKNFKSFPLFTITVPVMVWSFVDYTIQKKRERIN